MFSKLLQKILLCQKLLLILHQFCKWMDLDKIIQLNNLNFKMQSFKINNFKINHNKNYQ